MIFLREGLIWNIPELLRFIYISENIFPHKIGLLNAKLSSDKFRPMFWTHLSISNQLIFG